MHFILKVYAGRIALGTLSACNPGAGTDAHRRAGLCTHAWHVHDTCMETIQ